MIQFTYYNFFGDKVRVNVRARIAG